MSNQLSVCFFGTYDQNYTSNQMILRGLKSQGVKVIEVNYHIGVTQITNQKQLGAFALLSRVIKKWKLIKEVIAKWPQIKKTDIIYVGYPGHFDVFLAYPIAKLLRKKLVFNPLLIFYIGFSEEQGILNKQSLMGKLVKWGEGLVYRLVDLAFADTPYQKTHLLKLFNLPASKLKVLPIGADEGVYKHIPYKANGKDINVVYYGLYSPIHGVEHLVEAAKILKKEPGIRFTMVGNGNRYQEIRALIDKYKLTNFTFHLDAPEKEQFPLIASADVFLGFLQKHPTVDRVIPNKVYQGLAMGKVVLTAESPVSRSMFVHKDNIYFCQAANPSSIAKGLLELRDNPSLRQSIADNAFQLFDKNFSSTAIGKQLVAHINNLLER